MNPNCYHLDGPTGVKYATQHIRQVLQKDNPSYIIRADIKSFYKSIPHHKLIQDIKKIYHVLSVNYDCRSCCLSEESNHIETVDSSKILPSSVIYHG